MLPVRRGEDLDNLDAGVPVPAAPCCGRDGHHMQGEGRMGLPVTQPHHGALGGDQLGPTDGPARESLCITRHDAHVSSELHG